VTLSLSKFLALLANIRLTLKNLLYTNRLAYLAFINKEKRDKTLRQGVKVIRSFSWSLTLEQKKLAICPWVAFSAKYNFL
jgi:hypothetical protein